MLAVILNSFIGVSLSAGLLGNYYYRLGYSAYFRYFVTGFLIMVPASAVFLFEVNLHRWFDRNDLSHVILGIGITYFYFGVLNIFKEEHIV